MAREVCLLGYGKVARELHRPAWEQLAAEGRVRVTTICEPSGDASRLAQLHFPKARVVRTEAGQALTDTSCDIVDICTPGHTHGALTLQALALGLDVLVEKPLCHSRAEVEAIIAASQTRAVNVCQTLRFSAPAIALLEARQGGRLGRIRRLHLTHHARHLLNESDWVTSVRADGVLFENAIHFIDLCHLFLQADGAFDISGVKFYETPHRRLLTGFEMLASTPSGHHIYVDFLQDTLMHSNIQSRILVSGSGCDAELRFYPAGFRYLSGITDPISDVNADLRRLCQLVKTLVNPRRRAEAHAALARNLLDCSTGASTPLAAPSSVLGTTETLEQLAGLWSAASPPGR